MTTLLKNDLTQLVQKLNISLLESKNIFELKGCDKGHKTKFCHGSNSRSHSR